jgi:cytochrome b6-f complex iron-sulfur subunit
MAMRGVSDPPDTDRRSFLARLAMLGGLFVSYATAALYAVRFIVPPKRPTVVRKVYLTALSTLPESGSASFELPNGAIALVTRTPSGLVALSNRCPHLGCKVSWVDRRKEFFCPCHNGVFDPTGKALSGPPAEEGKDLQAFPLEVEGDAVFARIEEG